MQDFISETQIKLDTNGFDIEEEKFLVNGYQFHITGGAIVNISKQKRKNMGILEDQKPIADYFEKRWKEQDKQTRVKIETFKESGKFYDELGYDSNIPMHKTTELLAEAKSRVPQKGMDYTVEYSNRKGAWNKILFKVNN